MNTILNIKTEKTLKKQAQSLAQEMGIPLTTVVNAYLRQFVRDRKIVLDIEPQVNKELLLEWEKASADYKKGLNISKAFDNTEDLFKDLA